ncbi:MAG: hypothetical protein PHG14_16475 [Desulfobacter postgatei]|uniref:Uncharacterized protein n=1 Tax=Desulfobacter postgatei 2ac9 TaxID=879212 RepID=I5B6L9_9BACT|nr:hypothetical protein [Desulfobacter postgatei]EIM65132.1 hypothetical protein DespoDRAFT_03363 [Desulfobacter postgatei 2ac9]MDD4275308.1 hypothetical protein [Desulfobacter postgatei]
MKYLVSILAAALLTAVCVTIGTAQTASEENQPWHLVFASDLAKIADPQKTDGLGDTLTEEEALDQAIKKAIIDNKAPAWQVLKVAVGMNFNPYSVLSAIFKSSENVDLGQLYTYATETGGSDSLLSELNLNDIPIDKTVMQQAVNDALSAGLLTQNEVSKVQQLIDQGLAFTEQITPIERNDPAESNTDYSP